MDKAHVEKIVSRHRKALKKGYRIIRKSSRNTPDPITVTNLKSSYSRTGILAAKRNNQTLLDLVMTDLFNAGVAAGGGSGSGDGRVARLLAVAKNVGVKIDVEELILAAIEKKTGSSDFAKAASDEASKASPEPAVSTWDDDAEEDDDDDEMEEED